MDRVTRGFLKERELNGRCRFIDVVDFSYQPGDNLRRPCSPQLALHGQQSGCGCGIPSGTAAP